MKKLFIVFVLSVAGLSVSAQDNVKKDQDKTTAPTALSFTQNNQDQQADADDVQFFNVSNARPNKNVSSQALLLDFKCPLNPINSQAEPNTVLCTKRDKE
jgi:hypothetical protein